MATVPYMPTYVADWAADTCHLSAAEEGVYWRLVCAYWQRQKPLPADEVKLQRIARLPPEEWAGMRDTIAEFFVEGDGLWRHRRIDKELAKLGDKSRRASTAAAKRWGNKATPESKQSAEEMPEQCERIAVAQPAQCHVSKVRLDEENKEPTTPPSSPPRGKAAKPVRIPDDWAVGPREREYAVAQGMGDEQIAHEGAQFRDYWQAAAKNDYKRDWLAAWRTWVRNAKAWHPTGPPTKAAPKSSVDAFEARWNRQAELEREQRQREAADDERVSAADLASLIPDMKGTA